MKEYNVKEFAELIGVSTTTLHRWRKEGHLVPNRTLGGRPYYTEEHLIRVKRGRGSQDV